MVTAEHVQGTATPRVRRRRRRLPRLLAVLLVLVAAVWFAAAWYFTGVLYEDALEVSPQPPEPATEVEVLAVGDGSVTLGADADAPSDVRAPGTFGLWWPGGYGTVTEVVAQTDSEVTRAFTAESGRAPSPGTLADVDKYAFGDTPDEVLGLAWEAVAIPTPLGDLDAWLVPADGGERTWAVLVHGKGADRDEMLRILATVHEEGLPALVVTYRGDRDQHVDPSGRYGYGETEWADLDAAVSYALEGGASDVVLAGASTGAALIGAWFDRAQDTETVAAVVLDAPNADVERTFAYGASQRTVPGTSLPLPAALSWTAFRLSELRFGLDLSELDVSDTLAAVDVPVLAFHGTGDLTVPVAATRELVAERAAASLPTTYVETAAGEHVGSWNHDPGAYRAALATFLAEVTP